MFLPEIQIKLLAVLQKKKSAQHGGNNATQTKNETNYAGRKPCGHTGWHH
jgi:hypothetical protein